MYVMQVERYKFHTIAGLEISVDDILVMDVLHPWTLKMHSQHFMHSQHSRAQVPESMALVKILGTSGGAPTAQQEHYSTDDK